MPRDARIQRTVGEVHREIDHDESEGKDEHRPLQAGMTFHVIPMLMRGDLAIATTDTVLVTPTGGEALSDFDRSLRAVRA